MTKKEMDKLADVIVTKLILTLTKINNPMEFEGPDHEILKEIIMHDSEHEITEEEMLLGELARLQTLLMIYENNEEYEKAAVLLSKLNHIKTKLRKGDYNDED